jgi:NNP family nitrate/nitrite transporter-like MFS transporter
VRASAGNVDPDADSHATIAANGFAGGWGNGGSAIAFFMMPAVYDSIRRMGRTSHVAWRVSFVVPTIMLLACAAGAFFLCDDTPTGKWEDRFNVPGNTTIVEMSSPIETTDSNDKDSKQSKDIVTTMEATDDEESGREPEQLVMETPPKPSLKDSLKALCCIQTAMLAVPYACSFGGELAMVSILSSWYQQKFPTWGQTKSGQVAAAFGAFNVVFRPLGGFLSDRIYGYLSSRGRWGTKGKQLWYGFVSLPCATPHSSIPC